MGILNSIYNWLARRNIGQVVGLKWDPSSDEKYQRSLLIQKAEMELAFLGSAERLLSEGNYEKAGFHAYRAMEGIPDIGLPITNEVLARARSIIAVLPPGFEPPDPRTEMTADKVLEKMIEANSLHSEGRTEEAKTVMGEVLKHQIIDGEKAKAEDVYMHAMLLLAFLTDDKDQTAQ